MSYDTLTRFLFDSTREAALKRRVISEVTLNTCILCFNISACIPRTCRCVNRPYRKERLTHRQNKERLYLYCPPGLGAQHANGCMSPAYGGSENIVHMNAESYPGGFLCAAFPSTFCEPLSPSSRLEASPAPRRSWDGPNQRSACRSNDSRSSSNRRCSKKAGASNCPAWARFVLTMESGCCACMTTCWTNSAATIRTSRYGSGCQANLRPFWRRGSMSCALTPRSARHLRGSSTLHRRFRSPFVRTRL